TCAGALSQAETGKLETKTAAHPSSSGAAEGMPNIVLFFADDMGMGDTSVYQDWCGNPDGAQ
ncbi:MAG: hypothetical protein GWO24_08065, partial [Akkermansiaceae bacterium]|nr:hypothetical protein [Akkermansiaceae bacterium]